MWTRAYDDTVRQREPPRLVPARRSIELIVERDDDEGELELADVAETGATLAERRRGAQQRKRLPTEVRDVLGRARDLLADAAAFERGFDFTAAVARARDAAALLARLPCDRLPDVADLAAEVELERGRFDTHETAWRREVEARGAAHVARESAEAYGHLDGLSKRRR